MNIQLIDKKLLSELHSQAIGSERKRMHLDLRNTQDDNSQRMLNALEPGTNIPVNRHVDTSETVICIEGSLEWVFYEVNPNGGFKEIDRHRICPREGKYGIQVPKDMWHSVEVYEPSVIFEAKDGKYVPATEK